MKHPPSLRLRLLGLLGLSLAALPLSGRGAPAAPAAPVEISGIYPHLAVFNCQLECGIGAVVPWADRLWLITYGPHSPKGSTDKLYSVDSELNLVIHPASVGGTHANRLLHRESQQLFIGPYVIDARGDVRVIPPTKMFGRLTGNARHLTAPAGKLYFATMEEGIYEVDVRTLEVTELFRDAQLKPPPRHANLPGGHGKGLYSGQGRLIYSNNGDSYPKDGDKTCGCLAEWDGVSDTWRIVRRNPFTEVTGPGGISGNPNPATDPVWSIGWDERSLVLMVLDRGTWHAYRLPRASHTYDAMNGWFTEWPRIRDIGEKDLLMIMHGTFWRFPRNYDSTHSAGIAPRSDYLKIVGDFTRWGDRVVLGCDDTMSAEAQNKRPLRGNYGGPGQSQSNLWFLAPSELDRFGPSLGRGAVWHNDPVKRDVPSEPFLFSGYEQRSLHLVHDAGQEVTFVLEVDRAGNNTWTELRRVNVPASGYTWTSFSAGENGAWIRVRATRDLTRATAYFSYHNADRRPARSAARFAGLLEPGDNSGSGGLLHARGEDRKTLGFAARTIGSGQPDEPGFYEMRGDLQLRRTSDGTTLGWMEKNLAMTRELVTYDAASVILKDDRGRRYRVPRGRADFAPDGPFGTERVAREIVTERDLLNCAGTFFELPHPPAGSIARLRPIATHNRRIHDFASWRGLLVMSGVTANAPRSKYIVRSDDGRCALWVGGIDDLWQFGKPRGVGGPWRDSAVKAGEPSDPYLMTGYDRKQLTLAHSGPGTVKMRVEVDISGLGDWQLHREVAVSTNRPVEYRFPAGFDAYWARLVADRDTTATGTFRND